MFVGYPDGTKGYKLYDVKTRRFIRSRDVIFAENEFHDFDNGQSLKLDLHFFYPVYDVPIVPDVIAEEDQIVEEDQQNIDQAEPEIHEPAVPDNQPVGATYEDHFMREVENLPPRRQRKPPVRLADEGSYNAVCALRADTRADSYAARCNAHCVGIRYLSSKGVT